MPNRAVQRLKDYAAARDLPLQGLADACRVPKETLTGWLYRGKRPRAKRMQALDLRGIVSIADWYAPSAASDDGGDRGDKVAA